MNTETSKAIKSGTLAIQSSINTDYINTVMQDSSSQALKKYWGDIQWDLNMALYDEYVSDIYVKGDANYYWIDSKTKKIVFSHTKPELDIISVKDLHKDMPRIDKYHDPIAEERADLEKEVYIAHIDDVGKSADQLISKIPMSTLKWHILRMCYAQDDKGKRLMTEVRKHIEESTLF
jgi:hypothetical protein